MAVLRIAATISNTKRSDGIRTRAVAAPPVLTCIALGFFVSQCPFPFLYRDADVEGMTDGWDDTTAYGWEWASASTSWPAPVAIQRNMRLSARNSGLFSLRATQVRRAPLALHHPHRNPRAETSEALRVIKSVRSVWTSAFQPSHSLPLSLSAPPRSSRQLSHPTSSPWLQENLHMMRRLAHRMATEDVWDQTAYNEEQFYASYGGYHSPGVTQRLMNYLCFQVLPPSTPAD